MSAPVPLATVVIPTHNRRGSAARTLDALARQTSAPDSFEVVIAANACRDDTVAWLRGMRMPSALRVLDLPAPGAAAARNAGARAARGTLLIFLDDDVEAAPEFVAAHLAAHAMDHLPHRPEAARVAIGYLPAALQPEADLFAIALLGWWEAMFDRMREPGHRFAYTDLLTGNFSVRRDFFFRIGGFDERYGCHEDYEFGYRLIASGAQFVFAEQAWGHHVDLTRLPGACRRKREEGRADVQLASQYPELLPGLPLANRTSPRLRVLRWLAFRAPWLGDAFVSLLGRWLNLLERVGARSSWQRVLNGMLGYWYERGLADGARALDALHTLLAKIRPPGLAQEPEPATCLDISDVDAAERRLDEARPAAVVLCVGSREFGWLPPQPGAEPLAGRHLRPALARVWHRFYVEALLAERRLPLLGSDAGWPREPAQPNRPQNSAVHLVPGADAAAPEIVGAVPGDGDSR